jgi:outer membrane lipoprotein-sorting protein
MRRSSAALAIVLFSAAVAAAQSADEIVNKSIAARGGLEKIKAVNSVRLTGRINLGPEIEGMLLAEMERPGKMREQVTVGDKSVIRTTDGSTGWSLNQFAGQEIAVQLSAEEMAMMAQKADFDRPLVDYQAKGNKIELLGQEPVEGKPAYKLKVTLKDGQVRYDYIDAGSFQEVKWEGQIVVEGKQVNAKSIFSDYRLVDGVMYPFRIDSETEGSPNKQVINFDKVEINPHLDAADFAKPAVPKPPETPRPSAEESNTTPGL